MPFPLAVCVLMAALLCQGLAQPGHLQQDTHPDPDSFYPERDIYPGHVQQDTDPGPFRPARDIYPGPSPVKRHIPPDDFRPERDVYPDPGYPQQDVSPASRRALLIQDLLAPQPVLPAQDPVVNPVAQTVLPAQVPVVNPVAQTVLPAQVSVVNPVTQPILPAQVPVVNPMAQTVLPAQVPVVNPASLYQLPRLYGAYLNAYYQTQNNVPDSMSLVLRWLRSLQTQLYEETAELKDANSAIAREERVLQIVNGKLTELQTLLRRNSTAQEARHNGAVSTAAVDNLRQDLRVEQLKMAMETKFNQLAIQTTRLENLIKGLEMAAQNSASQNGPVQNRGQVIPRAAGSPSRPSGTNGRHILSDRAEQRQLHEEHSDVRRAATEQEQQTNSSSQSPEHPGGHGNTQSLSKPAFSVKYEAGQGSLETGDQGAVRFSQVVTNVGSGYNDTTGHFTAPLAGQYAFFLSVHATYDTASLGLYRSANHTAPLISVSGSRDSGFVTTTLTKGEDVYVRESSNGSLTAVSYATFSGHLI